MLPRMPGNKTAIFTMRIVAFHEMFDTVGKKAKGKGKENNPSVVWHEGSSEEIASAFVSKLYSVMPVLGRPFWDNLKIDDAVDIEIADY